MSMIININNNANWKKVAEVEKACASWGHCTHNHI